MAKRRVRRRRRASSINFGDPQLNAAWLAILAGNRRAKQRRQRQSLKGIQFPQKFEDYFFGKNLGQPSPGGGQHLADLATPGSAWNPIESPSGEEDDGGWFGSGSPLGWTIDKLSRPLYGAAEGAKDFSEEFTDVIRGGSLSNQLQDIGDMFRAGGAGAIQGLTGKRKTTFGEVLRNTQANPLSESMGIAIDKATGVTPPGTSPEWWRSHNKTTAGVGLTADILLDPLNFIGVGLVTKPLTGARIFKNAAEVGNAVKRTEKMVDNLIKTGRMSKLQGERIKDILTARKYRLGFQKQADAKAAEGGVADIVRQMADDNKTIFSEKVFADTLDNLKLLPKGRLQNRKGRFMSPAAMADEAATKAGDEAAETTIKAALDNYRTIVDADYKRALGLGTRNVKVPVLPGVAVEQLARVAQIAPIQKGLDLTQNALRNSYKIIEDVYRVKTEAMHLGRSTTYMAGRYIDDTFKHVKDGGTTRRMTTDDRKAEWIAGLQRVPGQLTVKAPGSKQEQIASDVFSAHVDMLSQRVMGVLGELPYSPAELNKMLPPGLPPIFKEKKMKQIAKEQGFVNKEGMIVKPSSARGKELKELYRNQDWFRDSLIRVATDSNIKGMKDGGHALWIATAAVEHAAARRTMIDNLANSFGFARELGEQDELGKILIKDLMQKRGYVEAKGVKELEGHVFNPEVAEGISKMLRTMDDQREWSKFTKFMNRITNPWKFLVTQPNPGYHIRNLMGDAFINWIDGAVNPSDYFAAGRLMGFNMKNMEKFEAFREGADPLLRMAGDPLENALKIKNKPLFKNSARLRDAQGTIKKFVLDSELYAGVNKHGIRQNLAKSQFGELESAVNTFETAFSGTTRKLSEPFRRASEQREDYMRIAHFIHLVKSNPSKARTLDEAMQWAGDRVRMTHFDYTDFTKFEQQYLSNIFPFYKWTRKALPLMARFMFEHPGRVTIPEKITRNLSGAFGYWPGEDDPLPGIENELVPDWLKAGGYLPMYTLPGTDDPVFAKYPSPFSDILSFQGGDFAMGPKGITDSFISQSTPYARIPYEVSANRQTMFAGENVPITNKAEYATAQLPIPFMRQILAAKGTFKEDQGPPGGEGNFGGLLTNLTGMYSRQLSERDQRNALYDKLFSGNLSKEENARIRAILREQFGIDI